MRREANDVLGIQLTLVCWLFSFNVTLECTWTLSVLGPIAFGVNPSCDDSQSDVLCASGFGICAAGVSKLLPARFQYLWVSSLQPSDLLNHVRTPPLLVIFQRIIISFASCCRLELSTDRKSFLSARPLRAVFLGPNRYPRDARNDTLIQLSDWGYIIPLLTSMSSATVCSLTRSKHMLKPTLRTRSRTGL